MTARSKRSRRQRKSDMYFGRKSRTAEEGKRRREVILTNRRNLAAWSA